MAHRLIQPLAGRLQRVGAELPADARRQARQESAHHLARGHECRSEPDHDQGTTQRGRRATARRPRAAGAVQHWLRGQLWRVACRQATLAVNRSGCIGTPRGVATSRSQGSRWERACRLARSAARNHDRDGATAAYRVPCST